MAINGVSKAASLAGIGLALIGVVAVRTLGDDTASGDHIRLAQEQRLEIVIRDSAFLLTQPVPLHLGRPMVIILRNQDIIRHGFSSPMLPTLKVMAEGEGVASYGNGIGGFYVDPNKTLVIRFTPDKPGNYSFRCDLHPQMKSELFTLEAVMS